MLSCKVILHSLTGRGGQCVSTYKAAWESRTSLSLTLADKESRDVVTGRTKGVSEEEGRRGGRGREWQEGEE